MNSTIKPKPCPECGSKFHSRMYHNPRKPIAVKKKLVVMELDPCASCGSTWHYTAFCPKRAKKIPKGQKVWARWSLCKEEWFRLYGSNHPCHYCEKPLNVQSISLDHKIPRSRAPELRYDFNNLVPCCFTCNGLKGSIEHDKYPHNCNDRIKA